MIHMLNGNQTPVGLRMRVAETGEALADIAAEAKAEVQADTTK
jgi:hypothetical protein